MLDKYKKLMCVKGLIMSLDEQIYRIDGLCEKGLVPSDNIQHNKVVDQYYKSIVEFLNKEDTNETA